MPMLKPGDPAPDFELPTTAGAGTALKDLRGRKVVLYFYPKDQTQGCTTEACDFRDHSSRIRLAGAEVLGVSKDSLGSHERFREKYDLPFDLLSDPDNSVATAYGAYGEKTMYGRKVMGTIRSTFLIDEKGKIEAVWSPVRVKGHVEKVLATLQSDSTTPAKTSPVRKVTKKKTGAKKSAVKKKTVTKKSK